jgi:hypothetical protein
MTKDDMIIGDEVVCIGDMFDWVSDTKTKLTVYKKYKITNIFRSVFSTNEAMSLIQVVSDDGTNEYFPIANFISIQEYRELQIRKIV